MIKTKIIHGKVDILLIGNIPEGIAPVYTAYDNVLHIYTTAMELPPGNWQPINWLDKVSEEEAEELVDRVDNTDGQFDPTGEMPFIDYTDEYGGKKFSKQSLLSLVEANVNLRNKYGHCPVTSNPEFINKWFEEEEKVWKNIYLLKKIEH